MRMLRRTPWSLPPKNSQGRHSAYLPEDRRAEQEQFNEQPEQPAINRMAGPVVIYKKRKGSQ